MDMQLEVSYLVASVVRPGCRVVFVRHFWYRVSVFFFLVGNGFRPGCVGTMANMASPSFQCFHSFEMVGTLKRESLQRCRKSGFKHFRKI